MISPNGGFVGSRGEVICSLVLGCHESWERNVGVFAQTLTFQFR